MRLADEDSKIQTTSSVISFNVNKIISYNLNKLALNSEQNSLYYLLKQTIITQLTNKRINYRLLEILNSDGLYLNE